MEEGRLTKRGEPVCLAFANTAGFHALEGRREELESWPDLVRWAHDEGLLSKHEAAKLRGAGEEDAAAILAKGVALRDVVQALFSRIARNRAPSPQTLAALNESLREALPHLRVAGPSIREYHWSWVPSQSPERILWPVVRSAAELLTSDDLARLRECSGRDCSRLFLDHSRNASRRWCSMEGCGNRAKVRRFYRRAKEGAGKT
jgi:predicted RNA-binding Zn ribbon-like protein